MKPDNFIHTLVRGVIVVDAHIFVAHCKGAPNTFLPGGHVAHGESLRAGLARELSEEFGFKGVIGHYLGAVEHGWSVGEDFQHEINHLFEVSLPGTARLQPPTSREAHLEFFWVPVSDLARHDLRPAPLVDLVGGHVKLNRNAYFGSTLS